MSSIQTTKILKNLDETTYMSNGFRHREDGPAVISPLKKEWWINGQLHRDDGPARICNNGSETYYVRGQLHRVDGPAVKLSNGLEEWWVKGQRHRRDGPAYKFGIQEEWWVNGKLHRTNGPAVSNKIKDEWYEEGERHRTDGPAVVFHMVDKKVWYINGLKYDTEEEFRHVITTLRKEVAQNLYDTKKVCKYVANYITSFVY